jgi:hypothetical protein
MSQDNRFYGFDLFHGQFNTVPHMRGRALFKPKRKKTTFDEGIIA